MFPRYRYAANAVCLNILSFNAGDTAITTKEIRFIMLLTNPFAHSVCADIPPAADSLNHRIMCYLLLLFGF